MLQESAVCGDKHAVFDLASVNNLKLVPGADPVLPMRRAAFDI